VDDAEDVQLEGTGACGDPWTVSGSTCRDVLERGASEGDGHYLLHGPWGDPLSAVYCNMTDQGGGWTLASVHSDDGVDTWTMDARSLLGTDPEARGDACDLTRDYRAPGAWTMPFEDLLFRHLPSGTLAGYNGVLAALGSDAGSLGGLMESIDYPGCGDGITAIVMTAGTLAAEAPLCGTELFLHPGDHEDGLEQCLDLERDFNHATWGPTWSASYNSPCPLDDPSATGLGPVNHGADGTGVEETVEAPVVGWGHALQLNTGAPGTGENRMELLIR